MRTPINENQRKQMFAKALLDQQLQRQGIEPVDPRFESAIGMRNSSSSIQSATEGSGIGNDALGSESIEASAVEDSGYGTSGGSGTPSSPTAGNQSEWGDWNARQRSFPTMAPSFPVGSN